MSRMQTLAARLGAVLIGSMAVGFAQQQVQFQTPPMPELPNQGLGETDQPMIPGQPWRIRDLNRPRPVTVTPARHLGDPPSDGIVWFAGKGLSPRTGTAGGRGRTGGLAGSPPTTAS